MLALGSRLRIISQRVRLVGALLAAILCAVGGPKASPQVIEKAAPQVDSKGFSTFKTSSAELVALANHHPKWANPANSLRGFAADEPLPAMTIVLSQTKDRAAAFAQLLADQQDPKSPQYHHWLTPAEVGERFGPSKEDAAAVRNWLQAQGLRVTFVAPSRLFIGFRGNTRQVEQAFHTQLRTYDVHGTERMSVATDPLLPAQIAPLVKSVLGLYTIEDHSFASSKRAIRHADGSITTASPELTLSNGDHFLTPADFATIYDLPTGINGAGQTIGIVGRSRVDAADVGSFQEKTDTYFLGPTEIIPTAFGGVDPGPPYTSPPAAGTSLGDQLEATLDVTRAGSIMPNVQVDLVVATNASGGIAVAAQYLVQTTPVPAQVMSISFGACESEAGPSGVTYWDTLFQQAAAEGISTFVSAGDAGASGCDANFGTPPANPEPNSPNYICSSSYATCVGGTEFNDTSDPGAYWSLDNSSNLGSALGYIPEGAWNEPLNSHSQPVAAASGGGVSSIIATPTWQTGTGVPSERTGRYTPDIAFSASGHDGYFACFEAGGASCEANSSGEFEFESFYGTSAAAPSMAGITALLDQNIGIAQGNLNPQLYPLTISSPSPFHDVTIASSGVRGCSINTPSMCNNSIPGPAGLSGGQAGFLIGDGYDEVTGLGSLDVRQLLATYIAPKTTPTVTIPTPTPITTAQIGFVDPQFIGRANSYPTGTAVLTGGGYTSPAASLTNGYAQFLIPADVLRVGTDTLTITYTPDQASSSIYNTVSGTTSITVTSVPLITPLVFVGPSTLTPTTAEPLGVLISVGAGVDDAVPTGTVKVTSGSYSSGPLPTGSDEHLSFTIPAQSLAVGTDTLTATYTPDATSSRIYKAATGSATVTVTAATKSAPTVSIMPSPATINTAQAVSVAVNVSGESGDQAPSGTVSIMSGSYNSGPGSLGNASVTFTIPAGSLPIGTDTLTATYTPDSGSSAIYLSASGTGTVVVTAAPPPSFTITGSAITVAAGASTGNTSTLMVTPANGFTGSVSLTASVTTSPANAIHPPTVAFGTSSTGTVTISGNSAGTTALTVTTTAASGCTQANEGASESGSGGARSTRARLEIGGAALASCLLIGLSGKRRRSLLSLLLLVALATCVTACGGGGGTTGNCGAIAPGTTAGSYTITVTGTSGSLSSTGTVSLTVQ